MAIDHSGGKSSPSLPRSMRQLATTTLNEAAFFGNEGDVLVNDALNSDGSFSGGEIADHDGDDDEANRGTAFIHVFGTSRGATFIDTHQTTTDIPADAVGEAVTEMLSRMRDAGNQIDTSTVVLTFKTTRE